LLNWPNLYTGSTHKWGVTMTKRTEDEAALLNGGQVLLAPGLGRQQLVHGTVVRAGVPAGPDLSGRDPRRRHAVQHRLEGQVLEKGGENPDSHAAPLVTR